MQPKKAPVKKNDPKSSVHLKIVQPFRPLSISKYQFKSKENSPEREIQSTLQNYEIKGFKIPQVE